MRKNEHPGCSCRSCKRGRRTSYGHYVIKHKHKQTLAAGGEDVVLVSTPYTD